MKKAAIIGAPVIMVIDSISHNRCWILPYVAMLEGEYGESFAYIRDDPEKMKESV